MRDFGGAVRGVLSLGLCVGAITCSAGTAKCDEPAITMPAETRPSERPEVFPLGGRDAEARLARLIRETLPPTTRPSEVNATQPGRAALDGFPTISHEQVSSVNGPINEEEVLEIGYANDGLDAALARYEPSVARGQLEPQMAAEKDPMVKLYLAALAGRVGSRAGAMHLLEMMKSTRYATVRNVHVALEMVLKGYKSDPPDWIIELAMAALADER